MFIVCSTRGCILFPFEFLTSGTDILMKLKHFIKILDTYLIKFGSINIGSISINMKPKLYPTRTYVGVKLYHICIAFWS